MRTYDLDAWNRELDVCRSREKGWQSFRVGLVSMVLKNVAQLLVKLLDSAVSKGLGISKASSLAVD